jgi:hypothetical protein
VSQPVARIVGGTGTGSKLNLFVRNFEVLKQKCAEGSSFCQGFDISPIKQRVK